jgi:hypothetical protein
VAHRREATATRRARRQDARQAKADAKVAASDARRRAREKWRAAKAARRSLAFEGEGQGGLGQSLQASPEGGGRKGAPPEVAPPESPLSWLGRTFGFGPSQGPPASGAAAAARGVDSRGGGGAGPDSGSESDDSDASEDTPRERSQGRSGPRGVQKRVRMEKREGARGSAGSSGEGSDSGSENDGGTPGSPWDALKWYPIWDPSGRLVGEAYIGVRFDLAAVADSSGVPGDGGSGSGGAGRDGGLRSLTAVEQLLFAMYDVDEDGLLSPTEFTTLVHDLRQVHGDIDALAGRRSNPGCLGTVIGLPDTDLMTYVTTNHTLSPLFLGHVATDHWSAGVGGVEITRLGHLLVLALTLVYSFTVNALVEVAFWHVESETFHDSGIEPTVVIFVKTLTDVVGSSLLKELLFFSNLHHLHPALRVALNLAVILLVFATSIYLLFATQITDEQLQGVWDSFVAVWFLARITEIFHLGTLWALKVSYGSSVGCSLL